MYLSFLILLFFISLNYISVKRSIKPDPYFLSFCHITLYLSLFAYYHMERSRRLFFIPLRCIMWERDIWQEGVFSVVPFLRSFDGAKKMLHLLNTSHGKKTNDRNFLWCVFLWSCHKKRGRGRERVAYAVICHCSRACCVLFLSLCLKCKVCYRPIFNWFEGHP